MAEMLGADAFGDAMSVEVKIPDTKDTLAKDLGIDKSLLSGLNEDKISDIQNELKNNKDLLNKFKFLINQNNKNLKSDTILKFYNQIKLEQKFEENNKKIEKQKQVNDEQKQVNDEQKQVNDEQKQVNDEQKQVTLDKTRLKDKIKENSELAKKTAELVSKLDLTHNTNYKSWQEEAKQKILSQKPELAKNPTDLNSLVNSYILISHQNELSSGDESLKREISGLKSLVIKSSYEDVFKGIAIDEAFKDKPGITNFDTQKAKASLLPDGNDVKIEGNKIESFSGKTEEAKQIIELDEANSPKKFIEKNGYRLETTQDFLSNTDYEINKKELKKEYDEFNQSVNSYVGLNKVLSSTKAGKIVDNSINELLEKNGLDKTGELRHYIDAYNLEINPHAQENPSDKLNNITPMQKVYSDKIEQMLTPVLNKLSTNLMGGDIKSNLEKKAIDVEKKEAKRVTSFREIQSQKDLEAENTIDFLNNLGLTNIPQADLEYIFKQLNITQNLDPQLDINNGLAGTIGNPKQTKEYIFNAFSKIYSKLGYTNLDKQKIMDGQDFTLKNPDFKAKLKDTFSNENGFNRESILKILNSNETKPQENKQNKSENSMQGARVPTLA